MQLNQDTQVSWWQKTLVKNFTSWATLTALVVVILFGWTLIWPKYQEWRSMTRAQDLQGQLRQERVKVDNLKQQVAAWNSIKNQTSSDLQAILPSTIDIPNLLVQLEAVAAQSGFRFLGVSISETGAAVKRRGAGTSVSEAGVRPIKITLSLEGRSYNNFKALLENIRSSWR
ncbi:TPA: hypothetical protein DEB72_00500, partial [Patescibacteria group bacterium]|nr:hypothetical protein [Patescibacteria group bacterium]